MICRICNNDQGNLPFSAREMMYGMPEVFEYFRCVICGCLQIKEYPTDILKYYPRDYYSYTIAQKKRSNIITSYFRKQRAKFCITGKGTIGMFVEKMLHRPLMFELLKKCAVHFDSNVLEIGSGSGAFLLELHRIGFKRLTGIDPYIDVSINYDIGVKIIKGTLSALKTQYDLVILKDSLEHMPDQHEVLRQVWRLTALGGHVLIIMPIVGYAWRIYGSNWVGLDAPRHFYIHSVKSMEILLERSGLEIIHTVYNSNEDQFIGSEQYAYNISIFDPRSYYVNKDKSIFSKEQITDYRKKAMQLNDMKDGDRLCIILKKVG